MMQHLEAGMSEVSQYLLPVKRNYVHVFIARPIVLLFPRTSRLQLSALAERVSALDVEVSENPDYQKQLR